jgi:hypothetical protein
VDCDAYACLLGWPPGDEFTEFCSSRLASYGPSDETNLWAAWLNAEKRIRELGSANAEDRARPMWLPLPDALTKEADEASRDPGVQRLLNSASCRWVLVDAERLIVTQKRIDLGFSRKIQETLGSNPTSDSVFRLAAGNLLPPAKAELERISSSSYSISSPSTDLRLLSIGTFNPAVTPGTLSATRLVTAIAVVVGFTANFISAIRIHNQLFIVNGTHRLHGLYERGWRYPPCLLVELNAIDELDQCGWQELKPTLDSYLRLRRPPLLKDFFDPQLHIILDVKPVQRILTIQINAQSSLSPR